MSSSPVTQNMYEEPSFLKTPRYRSFLVQLLASLNEFTFDLEKSLTWGIETWHQPGCTVSRSRLRVRLLILYEIFFKATVWHILLSGILVVLWDCLEIWLYSMRWLTCYHRRGRCEPDSSSFWMLAACIPASVHFYGLLVQVWPRSPAWEVLMCGPLL